MITKCEKCGAILCYAAGEKPNHTCTNIVKDEKPKQKRSTKKSKIDESEKIVLNEDETEGITEKKTDENTDSTIVDKNNFSKWNFGDE